MFETGVFSQCEQSCRLELTLLQRASVRVTETNIEKNHTSRSALNLSADSATHPLATFFICFPLILVLIVNVGD